MRKTLYIPFVLIVLIAFSTASHALDQYPGDTAIYGVSTATVQPNVLIILDNSGSMDDNIVTGAPYDPAVTYPQTNGCQGQPCQPTRVYRWRAVERRWSNFIGDVNTIGCTRARTALTTTGTYQGRLRTNGACSGWPRSFAIGNYINWLNQGGGLRKKIDVAKEVLSNLVNTTSGIKFGLMIFNQSNGGHIAGVGDAYGWSNYDAYIQDMDAVFTGSTTNRTALINTINNITPSTWTPLAETMYEALQYYEGDGTAFNGGYTYTTPIEYACQKNYVIVITDGMSTEDRSPVLRNICNNGDCDGDGFEPAGDPAKTYDFQGSDYLDDVAKYMYDNDHLADGADPKTTGKQNVITYTVGFGLAGVAYAEELLKETAFNGGGVYYSASSTGGLSESLREIIASIVEDNTSFVAPVLPVSPENRTYSGNRVYMGFFKPQSSGFWNGNMKKYGIDAFGDVVDKNGNPATNTDGSFRDNAVSYWSSVADGGEVEAGGAGAKLLTRGPAREIYTYTGSSVNLIAAANAFTTSNAAITASTLNVANATEKDRLINFVRGHDSYDEDSNGDTTELRDWILGDILHSRPTVVHYSTYASAAEGNCSMNRSLIFVGANDGMLHAFRDCDGSEAWGFIPQDLLHALKYLPGAVHSYYVDSSPSTYVYDADGDGNIEIGDGDKVLVIFGERRGGGYYYALDVSDPDAPKYLWRLGSQESPSGVNTDYAELAESWSEPEIKKIRVLVSGSTVTKVAAFIGAGYDNVAEDAEPAGTSTSGRGIYAVEVATLSGGAPTFAASGFKIWGYTNAVDSTMTRSFPSRLSVVDIRGNGYADRIYAGDTGGDVWRFDIGSIDPSAWTGRKIFSSGGGRKIFYRPAVTLEFGYELLFFGTGDRAHPTSTTATDRLYAVKDSGQLSARTETNLSDATSSSVNIAGSSGWFVALDAHAGEKVLSQSTVMSKVAYYTTYTPPSGFSAGVCSVDNRGTARFYALSYLNAAAAYNLNTLNDVPDGLGGILAVKDTTDRSTTVGSGIPSGMVTVITDSGISAIVGVGGSLVTPEVDDTGSNIPLYWKER
jgi:type IV pilus assembly protein PilY1